MCTSNKLFTSLFWFLVFLFTSSAESLTSEFTLPFERVTVRITMDDSGWVLGHEKISTGFTLIEWVPKGETVEIWSSQFRVLRYSNTMLRIDDARSLAKQFVETLLHRCNNKDAVHYEILEADATSALITWEMENCETDHPYSFDQKEMTRFIVGKEFTFNLAFIQNCGEGLQPGDACKLLDEDEQLAALRSAVIQESKDSGPMVETGAESMNIEVDPFL